MKLRGVVGKIAWVDLSSGAVTIEEPDESLYLKYLGGYGLGAYYLYTRQPANADPLGPDNTLGFTTGPLTGTQAITGNRFTVVGKSPKTGGWGDANCGGRFGPALKQAGLDAVFFTGISPNPVYALVENGQIKLLDASHLWGRGCIETEDMLQKTHGGKSRSAVIGQGGERLSGLACIINDKGRAAGRSGLGQVMGAKRLKAVTAIASGKVAVAQPEKLKSHREAILNDHFNQNNAMYVMFHKFGTPAVLPDGVYVQDSPIKNWAGTTEDFPEPESIGVDAVMAIEKNKYACWMCPIGCGGHVVVENGPYAGEGHKPEYETLGAFGTSCLNGNLESICRVNNICNDGGIDTISAGTTIAFAIECFENGVITKKETGGLALTWGNHEVIVTLTEQMVTGQGFGGTVLGDGIKKAVERIGPAAAPFAMECGGEELPLHDPRFLPGFGGTYLMDATPGRHMQWGTALVEGGEAPPDLPAPAIHDKYHYQGKGETWRVASAFGHVVNSAGLCMFASSITPAPATVEYFNLALGIPLTMDDVLEIGDRIANLRMAFNLREGIQNLRDFHLPKRVLGAPPFKSGPLKDVTLDNEAQIKDYLTAMGWNPTTGVPKREIFEKLGIEFAVDVAES